MKTLTSLDVSFCPSISCVGWLGKAPKLSSLNVSNTNVTADGLKGLEDSPSLSCLNASFCRGLSDVRSISKLRSLSSLQLGRSGVTDEGIADLPPNLDELGLQYCKKITRIPHAPHVKKLNMCQCSLSTQSLSQCDWKNDMASLHDLTLSDCPLSEFTALGRAPSLRSLCAEGVDVDDRSVASLNGCGASLQHLDLSFSSKLTDLHELALPSLQSLAICRTHVSSQGLLGILTRFPLMQKLNCMCCTCVHELTGLGASTSLEHLDLCFTGVTRDTLIPLVQSAPRLQSLILSECLSLLDVNALGNARCLRSLDLRSAPVQNSGVALLGGATALEELNLSFCQNITDLSFATTLTSLTKLNLSWTQVDNRAIASLSHLPNLHFLDLSHCRHVTDVSCLASLPALRELRIRRTGISPSSLEALSRIPTLERLDIAFCDHLM